VNKILCFVFQAVWPRQTKWKLHRSVTATNVKVLMFGVCISDCLCAGDGVVHMLTLHEHCVPVYVLCLSYENCYILQYFEV
jgi:hypothetical protein